MVQLALDILEALTVKIFLTLSIFACSHLEPLDDLFIRWNEGGDGLLVFTGLQTFKESLDVSQLEERVLEVEASAEQGGVNISQGQQFLGVNKSVSLLCWREAGGK